MAAVDEDPALSPESQRLSEQLYRLQQVTAALARTCSAAEIADVVIGVVLPGLGADGGVFGLLEDGHIEVQRSLGYGDAIGAAPLPIDAGLPITEAARTGQLIGIETADERLRQFPASRSIPVVHQSLVAVPLTASGTTFGVVGLSFAVPRSFLPTDQAFLLTVAQQCALALERCQLQDRERAQFVTVQEEARLLAALQHAGSALAGELDLPRVIQIVTDAATELSGAQFGAFFYNVPDDDGGSYMLYALSGVDPSAFEGFPMPRATKVFGPTFGGEGVIRLDDVTADPRFGANAPYFGLPPGHLPVRSYLAVPVESRSGEVIGGLFFGHPEPGRFTERSERLVVGVAGHAAVAVDNARLYEEQQRARAAAEQVADRLRRLQGLTSALSSALTVDEVIRVIAEEAAGQVGAPGRGVWLVAEDAAELRLVATALDPAPTTTAATAVPLTSDAAVAVAARTRTPVLVEVQDGGQHDADIAGQVLAGSSSLAAIPLVVEHRVIGVLALGFTLDRVFDDDDRSFFVAMGEQCAQALDRARLYESEQEARSRAEDDRYRAQHLAKALQTSLLPPQLPAIPNVTLDARYHAALEGMDVGGDFYDVFDTGGDWALVLGDVVGKGPEAAALTALVRYTLRSLAMDLRQPSRILRRLNETLILQQHDERFCTVAYTRVVPTVHGVRLAVCLGGHLPPLVLRADGTIESIGAPGGLIGLLPDIRLWEETVQLGPGESIVFFTDGVTEASKDGEEFGEEGVAAVLSTSAGLPAQDISRRIEEAVLAFGGPRPRDDLAILVLRVNP